jgi:hypothetical protein
MSRSSSLSRRTIMSGAAALPAAAILPNQAAAIEPDPIFAVIEVHRRAWADLGTECKNQTALEEEIPPERRRTDNCDDGIEAGDDSRWIALQYAMDDVHARINDAADAMLDIEPTTIAGVIALLSYAAEHVRRGAEWADVYEDPEPLSGWVKKHGLSWEAMLHMHVAKALQAVENRR